jgi:hypothetical protein
MRPNNVTNNIVKNEMTGTEHVIDGLKLKWLTSSRSIKEGEGEALTGQNQAGQWARYWQVHPQLA